MAIIRNTNTADNKIPLLQNKVSKLYGAEEETYNPFLDKNGKLFNEFINYQSLLDNPNITAKAKQFIASATGLTPSTPTSTVAAGGAVVSGGGVQPTVTQTGNSIADTAQKYLGTPYVWGGESMAEGGMDCSGFVYNALKDAGYNVGRTTAQGYRGYGSSVSKSEMQPGDLIFFGKNNDASHIGIYLGNGQMIHSSGGSKNTKDNPGKGVSITNVDYRSDFIEARRY
jgi:cell wall-associated NlpC family hydrolase